MNNNIKTKALKTFASSEGYNQYTDEVAGKGALDAYLNGVGYKVLMGWLAGAGIVAPGTTWEDVAADFGSAFDQGYSEALNDSGR